MNNTINNHDNSDTVRINKYISETGICSRREADKYIKKKRVTINGKIAEEGTKVYKGDIVKLNGKIICEKSIPVYIVLNKPAGITCTTEKKVKRKHY